MTTELSFLLDLLFEHELPKEVCFRLKERIKEVEKLLISGPKPPEPVARAVAQVQTKGEIATMPINVAQSPEAQKAMESRQQAIADSIAGKIDKVAGKPRKF